MEGSLTLIDLGILAFTGTGLIIGIFSGMIRQLGRIFSLSLGFFGSVWYAESLASWLEPNFSAEVRLLIGYIGTFILIFVVVHLVVFLLLLFVNKTELKVYDRIFGAMLGALKGAFIAGILLIGLVMFAGESLNKRIQNSRTGPYLVQGTRMMVELIPDSVSKKFNKRMNSFLSDSEDTEEDQQSDQDQKEK